MKSNQRFADAAFTLTELIIVVLVLGILVGLLIPGAVQWKRKAQRIGCVHNLKIIGLSFRIWSGSNTNDLYPMNVSTNDGGTLERTAGGETFLHFQAISNELSTPINLACPADRTRQPARSFDSRFCNTNVSYFVGLDSNDTLPQTFLTGDRNILGGTQTADGILLLWTNDPVRWTQELHRECGNVGMADGSVQQLSSAKLRDALANTGVTTNRLAIP